MSNSNIKLNLTDIETKALECKYYGGSKCNFVLDKIINDAEKKISHYYNVDPSSIKTDFVNFIPKNAELGYFDASGVYHKY